MKTIATAVLCFLFITATAQNPGWQELEEKQIGWDKSVPSNGEFPGKPTLEGFTYSKYRIALADTFISWIKKTYNPVGGLPQAYKTGIPHYSPQKNYPKGSGVYMQMWAPAYKSVTDKTIVKAQPASSYNISIFANYLPGLNDLFEFSTPDQLLFTCGFDAQGKFHAEKDRKNNEVYYKELQSKTGNYLVYFLNGYCEVVLIPGNELPFKQVTHQEFFTAAEAAINRYHAKRTGTAAAKFKQLNYLAALKEKYKEKLSEPVYLPSSNITVYSFDKQDITKDDILQIHPGYVPIPLYTFDAKTVQLCRQDKPQWITISFPYGNEKSKTVVKEIWKSMTERFNYDYVYDYFFNTEKRNGKAYQPLNK